ncbi:MAG TPA: hypothetical protein VK846_02305 [Candidatus Limnocylindria bacterium]|nr:hypothetical protein [Candidatus Limnocylindria bacterium]
MQKAFIGILAAAAFALGVLCLVQSKQLRGLREQSRTLEEARGAEAESLQAQNARVKELERSNRQLEKQVQKFAAVTTQLRTNEAAQASSLTAFAERMRAQKTGGDGEEKDGILGKGMGEMLGKMMKDPAMREIMREQQKAMVNMMYAGLFKDLNLSPDEKEKLKTLLTDAQMKNVEAAQGLFGGDDKSATGLDVAKQALEAKKQRDGEIKALLGDERFAQYQDYQKNVGERMQIDQFKNQMAAENIPMRDDQTAQLLQAMKEEKTALPPVISDDQSQIPKKEMFTADKVEQQLKWMDDYNRRVRDRAAQILSPEQLKQFEASQNQQKSMQQLGLNMARQMFGEKPAPAK